ncbi:MAG: hypothetical protein H5U01_03105, partial [Clostridia bacterium]|nr:hypothetical protein [Clostridia bacterium]
FAEVRDRAEKLRAALPGWEIAHTGGGYATAEEWLGALGHLDDAEDVEIGQLGGDGSPTFAPEAEDMLGEEALREIARAMDAMAG